MRELRAKENWRVRVRKSMRGRLERVMVRSNTHCGHEKPMRECWEAAARLEEWVMEEVEEAYRRGRIDGRGYGTGGAK